MYEQFMKLPKNDSKFGLQRRTAERIVDIAVPQVVKGQVVVSNDFVWTRFSNCFGG